MSVIANPVLKFQPLYTEWAILLPDAEWLAHADQLCALPTLDLFLCRWKFQFRFQVRINQPFNYYIFLLRINYPCFKRLFLTLATLLSNIPPIFLLLLYQISNFQTTNFNIQLYCIIFPAKKQKKE